MGVFYKVTDKQLLKDRNNLFKEVGIPALEKRNLYYPHSMELGTVSTIPIMRVIAMSFVE